MTRKDVVICLQARTNSSRLPGKVLLPVSGLPLSVLAAKRAGFDSTFDVRVLTSNESSDDYLAEVLKQHGLSVYRGSLDNVLSRFVEALADVSDDCLVVRLTADNVFPDSRFISDVIAQFLNLDLEYLCANGEASNLPYGLSAEVTRLRYLKEAFENTNDPYDIEHVTPYIRRKYGTNCYRNTLYDIDVSGYRCTVDNLDDYLQLVSVLKGVDDPVSISVKDLCSKLINLNPIPNKLNRFVVGCAQLGFDYGVNNKNGKPDKQVAFNLLSKAVRSGVTYIDTARAYGDSEKVIGEWLKQGWGGRCQIITKLSPLPSLNLDSDNEKIDISVDNSILNSCAELGVVTIDVLMLHRASHLIDFSGQIFKRLCTHKQKGKVKEIGVSVQTPEELKLALSFNDVSFIQLPFNILDHRWSEIISYIKQEKAKRKLNIHVRSVLLQGLLVSGEPEHWNKANIKNYKEVINWLECTAKQLGCGSIQELCIGYVQGLDWVDGLVIGCDDEHQVENNIQIFNSATLSEGVVTVPFKLDERSLNPALWS